MSPLATPNQLARKLNISRVTVRRLVRRGKLPHVRVGGQVRFDLDEVMESLKSSKRKGGPAHA